MKEVEFLGNSLEKLREFPLVARREAGFQISRLQHGLDPFDWKSMQSVGSGVREIRVREANGQYRVIYIAHLGEKIYVLHAFQKKTQKTAKRDIDLAKQRLQDLKRLLA